MKRHTTPTAELRNKWASIPGVEFPKPSTPAAPAASTTPRSAHNPNRRPRRYLQQPDIYTAQGTLRRHPIGTPPPEWIGTTKAMEILGLSRARLTYYVQKFALQTCRYADPAHPASTRVYFRESDILAILPKLPRKQHKTTHT